jgi:hypothetical protein
MGLKDILEHHKIPLPSDFDERMEVVQAALRNSPDFEDKLEAFKKKKVGGAIPIPVKPDSVDFLGPQLRWFVQVMGSPYAQGVVRSLFMIIFFISYLESIPLFGSILSAGLDVMVAGGKSLIKTVQTNIPPLVGLIPLPFMSLVGLMIASIFGLIMWPIFAMVSFSRQDFAVAIESSIRMIPPPIGNTIADLFMEANRMIAKIDTKRRKLADDIYKGIKVLTDALSGVSSQFKEQAGTLATKTKEVAKQGLETTRDILNKPSVPKMPTLPKMSASPTKGGKRFSRYSSRKNKYSRWRTKRQLNK